MTSPNAWTEDQLAELTYLRVVEGWPFADIARKLRKSVDACKAKLAVHEGRRTFNRPRHDEPPSTRFMASFESPPHRRNDDAKHLGLILKVHRGGFPVCGGRR